ncbi:aminotransferase class V-fold PLP-dependent enzyme [Botrimarina mediterranea]|uniref:cysteine desulfurase n=1 Tax=Botrimarina mediterranea TaxID=2528022 RepID=A0A518K6G9_9BACT|nr:aminotransferase class V-fold PLP-dependent enzyme [Botrimarina mediterranea]QDV73389.1 putative cysteine desulfurase [Botrimarina mediterranea]QDV77906.1 putative cysteine desulfurase [Planctomycetes bacterium K2D]
MPRIYLDNAATSWPKPETVYEAVDDWQRRVGASYARGTSSAADETRAVVDRARRGVAKLLGESDPRRVVLTSGGTDSLNVAIFGLVRPGDHVVATVCEHNAVLRPLQQLGESHGVETTWVGCEARGIVDADEVIAAIRPETRLVAMIQASNVTGAIQPVEPVAAATKAHGARLLVDAAQSMGRIPIDVKQFGADLVAAPGHKGLLGPLGTGVLWLAPGVEQDLRPLHYGGAASGGDRLEMPDTVPDHYEAGSVNMPGIAGLAAGVEHVLTTGVDAIRQQIAASRQRLADGLAAIEGATVYGPSDPTLQAGVVSFAVEGYDPHELASLLASVAGVECRAGLHCAPRLHRALGTDARGGLVRFSPGMTTSDSDLDAAIEAVRQFVQSPLT